MDDFHGLDTQYQRPSKKGSEDILFYLCLAGVALICLAMIDHLDPFAQRMGPLGPCFLLFNLARISFYAILMSGKRNITVPNEFISFDMRIFMKLGNNERTRPR